MIRPGRLDFLLLFGFLLCSGTLSAQVSTYWTNDNPNSPDHHYPGVRDTLLRNGVFSHRIRTDTVFYDDQLTFVNRDTAVFFLNSMGSRLSEIPCAAFYRVAPLNRYYQQSGLVTDYYLDNDSVAARLSYDNAVLDGPCWFYFRNGQVREKGIYTKSARRGIWDFYFENGQKEKSIQYTDSGVYLIDCFSKDGQTLAHEGNGRFEGTLLTGNYSSTTELKIVGSVKDGVPDGEWKLYSKFLQEPLFVEQFSSGRFIHGTSTAIRLTKDYDQNPISTVAGVEPVEAIDYYAHNDFCRLAGKKVRALLGDLSADRYAEIDRGIKKILKTGKYSDYSGWVLLDVKYDQRSRVRAKSVRLYQENEAFRSELLSMLDHLTRPGTLEVDEKDIPFERFYVVLVEANEAVIPEEFLDKRRRAALINPFSRKGK